MFHVVQTPTINKDCLCLCLSCISVANKYLMPTSFDVLIIFVLKKSCHALLLLHVFVIK